MNMKTCTIKLLNKTYQIKCPEQEEANLLLAVETLNEKMTENKTKFKLLDNFHSLLLAAVDISHQYVLCKKEQEQQRHQVSQFISSLESNLNKKVEELHSIPETD